MDVPVRCQIALEFQRAKWPSVHQGQSPATRWRPGQPVVEGTTLLRSSRSVSYMQTKQQHGVRSSGRQDIETSWMQHTYSVAPRNNHTERLFITWTNINRFKQFFHCRSHNWICNQELFIMSTFPRCSCGAAEHLGVQFWRRQFGCNTLPLVRIWNETTVSDLCFALRPLWWDCVRQFCVFPMLNFLVVLVWLLAPVQVSDLKDCPKWPAMCWWGTLNHTHSFTPTHFLSGPDLGVFRLYSETGP